MLKLNRGEEKTSTRLFFVHFVFKCTKQRRETKNSLGIDYTMKRVDEHQMNALAGFINKDQTRKYRKRKLVVSLLKRVSVKISPRTHSLILQHGYKARCKKELKG